MAVQMILGNVCDRTCRRMELFDGFQLEAADLATVTVSSVVSSAADVYGVPMFPTTLLPADMLS